LSDPRKTVNGFDFILGVDVKERSTTWADDAVRIKYKMLKRSGTQTRQIQSFFGRTFDDSITPKGTHAIVIVAAKGLKEKTTLTDLHTLDNKVHVMSYPITSKKVGIIKEHLLDMVVIGLLSRLHLEAKCIRSPITL
jgi:hypothetical protein